MRTIPKPGPGPARPLAAPLPANADGPVGFIRGAIRNSPWVVIAVTAHIMGIAVLSLIYVKHLDKPETVATVTTAKLVERPSQDESLPVAAPIELIDRSMVPAVPRPEDAGPVNPDDIVLDGARAGRRGENTPERDPNEEPGVKNEAPDAVPDELSGASGGTPIGVGRIGHRGTGVPSTTVSRFPGRNGRGRGGLGQGGDDGPGGKPIPVPTDAAVLAALRWLKNHQASDGRWDSEGFDARCKSNRCDGPGEATYDPGLTGLSLLAFLGAGHTQTSGTCRETVKNGIKYLRDVEDSEGCFGPRTSQHFLYNHACAALAMTEAYGMTGSRALREPAQRGIGFVLKARNPYMAWRYNVPADGDNDTSVTGWMVMALKSAKLSGLEAETGAINDSIAWVEKMTEPEFGRTGYQQRGGQPARTNDAATRFPAGRSESLTAVGLTVRIFGGRTLKDDEMIGKGADLLTKCLPRWDVDQGTIDYYYWYYGSLAMFQVGGERWKKWNEAVKTALLDHQRLEKDRCEHGSWDPVDPWSAEGGRVYATAINCLTMEVYYRYPLLGVRAETK